MMGTTIDRTVLSDLSWWHWAATIPLLALYLSGHGVAIVIAIGLCAIVGMFYLLRLKRLRPFPVQVRASYLLLLVAGLVDGLHWLHEVQLVGTSTMVAMGYCPLARLLSLASWNRSEPLTRSRCWSVLVSGPYFGGLFRLPHAAAALHSPPSSGCCSMKSTPVHSEASDRCSTRRGVVSWMPLASDHSRQPTAR